MEKMIAEERESSSAQIRTLLMSKEKRLSQSVARKFLITNSLQLKQNKNAEFYRENYCVHNRIFGEVQDLTNMKELAKIPKFYLR